MAHYADEDDPEEYALKKAFEERANLSRERIGKNRETNRKKSDLLNLSFYFVVISFAVNLATLVMRLF